jgi:hypothetical protein
LKPYISEKSVLETGISFIDLKKKGLEHIQNISGDLWTDYNHHDPGITILEQVCYALTEIAYQENLDISDLLKDSDGVEPDYESLALNMPNRSFSMHAIKPADYSRLLYDRIDGVVNAWLEPLDKKRQDEENVPGGLYHLYLNIIDNPTYNTSQEHARIKKEAIDIYNSNRNLGEDLDDITVLTYKSVEVVGKIILETARDPSEVMAEIILKIEECLTPRMQFVPLDKLQQDGHDYDDIFEGPRLINGIIPIGTYMEKPDSVDTNQVSEYIMKVPDVDSVRSLYFLIDNDHFQKIKIDKHQMLRFKSDVDHAIENVELIQKGSGRQMIVDEELFDRHYRSLRTALRRTLPTNNLSLKPALAKNPIRKPGPYYSIQHDFPAIYGINKYGVPSHESDLRKAQALQLKGYLYFFEQILAGGMELPHSLKALFSVKKSIGSYPVIHLDDSNIPGISKLYAEEAETHSHGEGHEHHHYDNHASLPDIYSRYDHYMDRKSRALDYLISLYGESCSLYSVSQFNYYYSEQEYQHKLLDLKTEFLEAIADLNYNRSGAFDYSKRSGDGQSDFGNVSGMELKARLLLGISRDDKNTREKGCRSGFELHGLKLKSTSTVDHADCYSDSSKDEGRIEINYNSSAAELQFSPVNFLEDMSLSEEECTELLNETRIFKDGIIDDELLKSGISLKNYRVGQITSDGACQVLLKSHIKSETVWRKLGNESNAKKACDLVLAYRKRLRELSVQSEDFHVLEHILLRPFKPDDQLKEFENEEAKDRYTTIQKERSSAGSIYDNPKEFFSHKISIFLPNWTARFSDPGYQLLVSETFNLLIPAHLACDLYWLSPEEMCDYENRYNRWLSEKSNIRRDDFVMDDLSEDLILFIENLEKNGDAHAGQ